MPRYARLQQHYARGFSDRTMFIGICAAALLLGLGLWWMRFAATTPPATARINTQALLQYPIAKVLAPFQLSEFIRQDATVLEKPFSNDALRGRWRLLFFGFTTCPDICPTTLTDLKALANTLGPSAPELVLVSVDPERDQPKVLRDYVDFFSPSIRAVSSNNVEALTQFAANLGAVFVKVPDAQAQSYTIDHSASLFLINPEGNLAGLIRPPLKMDVIAADLRAIIGQAASP